MIAIAEFDKESNKYSQNRNKISDEGTNNIEMP